MLLISAITILIRRLHFLFRSHSNASCDHAGATVRVQPDEMFNISMSLLDGEIREGGIWGMRVDYWDDVSNSYPPGSSLFFYDSTANIQVGFLPDTPQYLHCHTERTVSVIECD